MSELSTQLASAATDIEKLKFLNQKIMQLLGSAKKTGDQELVDYATKVQTRIQVALTDVQSKRDASGAIIGASKTSSVSTTILIALVASVVIAGGVIIYKQYLSKAAKSCKDKKGDEKKKCISRYKIMGWASAIRILRSDIKACSIAKKPEVCEARIHQRINKYKSKSQKELHKINENMNPMEPVTESYLNFLYDPKYHESNEIQGPNLPVEEDNKANWVRECMLLDENKEQINCLRRLKEMAAMNPFYQYRIDRFIDAITLTYEPTDKPGTVPGSELNDT